jgi:tRNA(adenine34) deaminase
MSSFPPPPDERVRHAMRLALDQARLAAGLDEVPVGAVVLGPDGTLLAAAHNEIEALRDPTAHAERLALSRACAAFGQPRLPEGSLLAVTLEPCAMCAGAIVLARARFLVFGAPDPKTGACGSLRDIVRDVRLNHRVELLGVELLAPLQADECGALLTRFFRARRPGGSQDCPPPG